MNKLFTLFLLSYAFSISAQISYLETDGPRAGISYFSRQFDTISRLNLDQLKETGGNKIWDVRGSYTELPKVGYLSTQNLYFKSIFPGANLAQVNFPNTDSSFAMMEKNSTGLYLVGVRDSATNILYSPKITLVPFPLNYGMNFQNTSSANYVQNGIPLKIDLISNSTVDAWGMMTTNNGTFPVIKLKSVRIISLDAFGFPYANETIETHSWLTSGLADALVTLTAQETQIDTFPSIEDTTLTNTYKQEVVSNHDLHKSESQLTITPNPVSDYVTIQCQDSPFNSASYAIVNAEGKTVMEGNLSANEALHLNLNHLPGGNYLVQMILDKKTLLFDILSKK